MEHEEKEEKERIIDNLNGTCTCTCMQKTDTNGTKASKRKLCYN